MMGEERDMTLQFRLPDLGEGITEAELVCWLVKPGDKVALDQSVAEVQTDKAIVELPSPIAGTVLELNVAEGQMVPVKTVLLTLGAEAEAPPVTERVQGKTSQGNTETHKSSSSSPSTLSVARSTSGVTTDGARQNGTPAVQESNSKGRRVLATPVARRMARDLGIDITTITGSGPAGRVRTEDVQQLVALKKTQGSSLAQENGNGSTRGSGGVATVRNEVARTLAVPGEREAAELKRSVPISVAPGASLPGETEVRLNEERLPLRGLRRRIAENMVISTSTIPQVTSMIEVDATGLVTLRQSILAEAEKQGVKLSYLPFIVKALIHALSLYPYVNSTIEGEQIVLKRTYHIGIATATPDGLLVPVLRDADRLTVLEIARAVSRLAEAGRDRKLQLPELRGSSFTISNYGTVGGFFTTPIINPGEAGILGLGRIVKRPWVVDDRVEVRPVLPLSFTADHRLIDGELAMRFMNTLIASLENPNLLLLYMR